MSEQRPPHRRRRPQGIPEIPDEEDKARQEEPRRIVIGQEDDQPDWLVSANQVSGAASRRTGEKGAKAAGRDERRAAPKRQTDTEEGQAILALKKKPVQADGEKQAASARTRAPASGRSTEKNEKKKAPRGLSKKAKARRNAQIRRTVIGVLCAVVFVALAAVTVIGGGRLIDIKQTLDQGDGVFYPNIFVNSIPLQGMTLDDAKTVVTQQVQNLISSWRITLRTQDGRSWDITGEDLKMQYDVEDQLDQLWSIGHNGSSSVRYEQVKALEETPAMRYTTLTYDLSRVNQILTQIKEEVDQAPVSATRVNDENKWPPFSYTDDVPGVELDITGLNEQITGMVDRLESGTVELTPTSVEAPVTRAYLEGQIVQLSTFETAIGATSEPGRFTNIEVGTRKFDRLIIKSGESVSFNKVAEKRTYANGYVDAPELAYGDYRTGVGGGICQVSSTLYNAVVNAGLQVVSRTAHSLASNYVPKGLDATVQDDRIDFVFKNSTNADIYISSEYYKKKNYWYCKFTIHGRPDPNGYSYKLESEVVEEIPIPEPQYIQDKDATYVVYDDEQYQTSKGEKGYIVDVYLVTMDSKGLTVSREKQYQDVYKARTPKVYVGVTPRETPTPETTSMD